jgi:microcompartment protein CcmK/EutM
MSEYIIQGALASTGKDKKPKTISFMQLARVIGTVVATVKNDSLEGRKLLVIQSLDAELQPQGKPLVALDAIGAGTGELVFWCRGKEASFPFKREDTPTDCTIIAIVDSDRHVNNAFGARSNR